MCTIRCILRAPDFFSLPAGSFRRAARSWARCRRNVSSQRTLSRRFEWNTERFSCWSPANILCIVHALLWRLEKQLAVKRPQAPVGAHLRHAHHFAVKVFDGHAQQTVRLVSGAGVDVVVKTRVLEQKKYHTVNFLRNVHGDQGEELAGGWAKIPRDSQTGECGAGPGVGRPGRLSWTPQRKF